MQTLAAVNPLRYIPLLSPALKPNSYEIDQTLKIHRLVLTIFITFATTMAISFVFPPAIVLIIPASFLVYYILKKDEQLTTAAARPCTPTTCDPKESIMICNNTFNFTFDVTLTPFGKRGLTKTVPPQTRLNLNDFFPSTPSFTEANQRDKFKIVVSHNNLQLRESTQLERGFYVALLPPHRTVALPRVEIYVTDVVEEAILTQAEKEEEPTSEHIRLLGMRLQAHYNHLKSFSSTSDLTQDYEAFFKVMICYHGDLITGKHMTLGQMWGAYKQITGLDEDIVLPKGFARLYANTRNEIELYLDRK